MGRLRTPSPASGGRTSARPGGTRGREGKLGRAVGPQEVGRGQGSCCPACCWGRGWCPSHGTPGLNPVLGGTSAVGRNSQRQLDGSEKENSGACKIRRVDISRTGRKTLRNTPAHGGGAMSLFPAPFPQAQLLQAVPDQSQDALSLWPCLVPLVRDPSPLLRTAPSLKTQEQMHKHVSPVTEIPPLILGIPNVPQQFWMCSLARAIHCLEFQ